MVTGSQQQPVERPAEPVDLGAAERILTRAVELDGRVTPDPGRPVLDARALESVAAELGMSTEAVRRAVAEHRAGLLDETPSPAFLERVFVHDVLSADRVVTGRREGVEEACSDWLHRHEGLRVRRRLEDGAVWERDRKLLTAVRMKLRMGEGTGALRSGLQVRHRVRPLDGGEQRVTLEVGTRPLRRGAAWLVAGSAAVGAAVGLGVANAAPDPQAALSGAATFALLGGGTWLGVRLWARRLREGLERALDGIGVRSSAR